tara:strand:- start:601 stop:900 length:300 start_codon:yes stop_codon:yes gene_type:complete
MNMSQTGVRYVVTPHDIDITTFKDQDWYGNEAIRLVVTRSGNTVVDNFVKDLDAFSAVKTFCEQLQEPAFQNASDLGYRYLAHHLREVRTRSGGIVWRK